MASVAEVLNGMGAAPVAVTSEAIWELREQIGNRSPVGPRKALNQAIKWARKKSTTADGDAEIVLWDLSRLRGLAWAVPRFKRPGKGQFGEWVPDDPCPVELLPLLAQLPEADMRQLFVWGDGLRGIALVAEGALPAWWTRGGADFRLVVVTGVGQAHLKADSKGALTVDHRASADRAGDGACGIQGSDWGRRDWKLHSDKNRPAFLYGGYIPADPELSARASMGGPDEGVRLILKADLPDAAVGLAAASSSALAPPPGTAAQGLAAATPTALAAPPPTRTPTPTPPPTLTPVAFQATALAETLPYKAWPPSPPPPLAEMLPYKAWPPCPPPPFAETLPYKAWPPSPPPPTTSAMGAPPPTTPAMGPVKGMPPAPPAPPLPTKAPPVPTQPAAATAQAGPVWPLHAVSGLPVKPCPVAVKPKIFGLPGKAASSSDQGVSSSGRGQSFY